MNSTEGISCIVIRKNLPLIASTACAALFNLREFNYSTSRNCFRSIGFREMNDKSPERLSVEGKGREVDSV
jgi:hypothetical protein